jgi:hypothetical protein
MQGKVLIHVQDGLGHRTLAPEYSADERAADTPYPGIEAFAAARESRDFHFPGPGRFTHKTFMPD